MKAKNKRKYLEMKINWWMRQDRAYQASTTKPGSIHTS